MAFEKLNVIIGRGRANNFSNSHGLTQHTYASGKDDNASISVAGYFPDYMGFSAEEVKPGDLLVVRDSSDSFSSYRIDAGSPLALTSVNPGGEPFDQTLDTTDPATFTTITATTGIDLPTTGGTPTLLDYYETGSFTVTWTGAFTSDQPGTIWFSRIGNIVTMIIDNENAPQDSSGTVFTLAVDAIPLRLRPTVAVNVPVPDVSDNGTFINAKANITTFGRILIQPTGNFFSGVGTLIWNDFSLTYLII